MIKINDKVKVKPLKHLKSILHDRMGTITRIVGDVSPFMYVIAMDPPEVIEVVLKGDEFTPC